MSRKRIGELLLERGVISRAQLEAGLTAQKRTRQRLGVTLVQQGLLSEVQLAQALAASLQLKTVDLNAVQTDWTAVHMLRARFCEAHELFPFAIDRPKDGRAKRLLVAMSDPLNQPAIEEIEFTTGLTVAPYVTTHSQVREAVLRSYHKQTDAAARANPQVLKAISREEESEVVIGEEIISTVHAVPAVEKSSVARELDVLFGVADEAAGDQEGRRFWALLRVLQKKGLLTREEFMAELDAGEDR